MNQNTKQDSKPWIDPDDDDALWTEAHFRNAAVYVGSKLVRSANGTWAKPGGRPISENPKKQVTLRLDPEVLEKFRATGKGWQSRINAELRKVLGI